MKLVWLIVFAASTLALLFVLQRRPLSRISLKKVIVHWIFAATALFLLNYLEFTQAYALPINPLTIGTAAVLGVPGLALLLGVQQFIV